MIKTGFGFFQKKEQSKADLDAQNSHEQNEITLEETRKGFTRRQVLGFVITIIILYNWIIVPVLDYFGIVLIQVPLGQLMQVLLIMIGGS